MGSSPHLTHGRLGSMPKHGRNGYYPSCTSRTRPTSCSTCCLAQSQIVLRSKRVVSLTGGISTREQRRCRLDSSLLAFLGVSVRLRERPSGFGVQFDMVMLTLLFMGSEKLVDKKDHGRDQKPCELHGGVENNAR